MGYKPYFLGLEEDWPSFVIEVGVLESHANLHAIAIYWLIYSDGKTHIVIMLNIKWIDRQILVE